MNTIQLPPSAALETAASELRSAAQNAPKRLAALNKAQYDLLVLQPQIVRIAGAYLVPSTTRGGMVHRVADVDGCSCEAGRAGKSCRHVVALELIETAQQYTMPALTRSEAERRYDERQPDDDYAAACAAMDELFA